VGWRWIFLFQYSWKYWSLMSPPLLSAEEGEQSNVSLVASSPSMDCISQNVSGLKERNYMGLSDCSSVDSSPVSSLSEEKKNNLNLKATELRLGSWEDVQLFHHRWENVLAFIIMAISFCTYLILLKFSNLWDYHPYCSNKDNA
jgi:hypothetical protein